MLINSNKSNVQVLEKVDWGGGGGGGGDRMSFLTHFFFFNLHGCNASLIYSSAVRYR